MSVVTFPKPLGLSTEEIDGNHEVDMFMIREHGSISISREGQPERIAMLDKAVARGELIKELDGRLVRYILTEREKS